MRDDIEGEVFDIYIGNVGRGKTLLLNELVVLPALIAGLDVYCNYWVNWSGDNFHYFHEFEEVANVVNCIVVFDEIQQVIDPRAWEKEGQELRRFFQEHRKNSVDIYGSCQHISHIAKSALVLVDNFYMCDKSWNGPFIRSVFPNFPWLVISAQDMTINELRLEDKAVMTFNSFSEDDDLQMTGGDVVTRWISKKSLLHYELDDNKIEYYHYYCPKCKKRQGPSVGKETPFEDALGKGGNCPKHREQELLLKESGMYDTKYMVKPKIRKHFWKPFKVCECGKVEAYGGALSEDEFLARAKLEK